MTQHTGTPPTQDDTQPHPAKPAQLTVFQGRVADRNPLGMAGAQRMGQALAQRLGLSPQVVGTPRTPLAAPWDVELNAARPELEELARAMERTLQRGQIPITTLGRCAAAIATLPVVARHHPDAAIVWFDAHADSNLPANSASGYLGGLVLTGAAGLWDTGMSGDLHLDQVVLVGARDIDPAEQALIDSGTLRLVPPGKDLAQRLAAAIGQRPVYIHLDCDVLEPGIVPTEYLVPGGLSLADLGEATTALAKNAVVGLEIAEFQSRWPEANTEASPDALIDALLPLLSKICPGV
jgi:arginase